jgi:long-chain acyl-CoA synthetase
MTALGFWHFAAQDPSRIALVTPEGGEVTRGELLSASNRIAQGLRKMGLQKGDCVAMVLPNSRAVFELYLATFQSGLYLTPINHHLAAPEIAYIVEDCEAKVFVSHERFADVATAAAHEISLAPEYRFGVGFVPGFRDYAGLGAGLSDVFQEGRTAGGIMNYTSGTTGRPKGVRRPLAPLPPETVAALFTGLPAMFGLKPEDDNVHLVGSPLYHTAVLMFASASMHMGHKLVVMDKWTPEGCLEAIEKHRVTTSHMVPTQLHRLLGLPEEVRRRYDVSSTRAMIHAAAPCPIEVKRGMLAWWGDSIWEYYAATEGGGTLISPKEWRSKPGSVGRPWPNAEIRIIDDAGEDCPAGTPGTVYMARGQADFEYYKDEDKTAKARLGNYFTVGDIGFLDEDGYLFLCDRKSDMIISGGVNIYPAEIEGVLLTHPKVADVAVFGVPNADWGEEVKAIVEPAVDAEAVSALAEDILAFCAGRLAKYKTPRSVEFIAEMPRDPNGKLAKRKLRDPYWEGRDRAI